MRFRVWLNSGANIHSCRTVEVDLKNLGYTEEEFNEMSEDEKEELFRDIAFANSDWGWCEI